jgi:hypothetical protein
MRPSQKELNDFILDLVEFLGKHFTSRFDKTRVAGGNEGVSIRIRRAESDSELEITTDRLDPYFDFGTVQWRYRQLLDSKEELFVRIQSDLIAVFMDRLVAVRGSAGSAAKGGRIFLDVPDAEAIDAYRGMHPDCDEIVLKKWTSPEATIPVSGS